MDHCLRRSPGNLQQHETVFAYLAVGEVFLAIQLILSDGGPTLGAEDRRRLVELVEGHDYEFWAVPGSAAAWIDEHLAQGHAQH